MVILNESKTSFFFYHNEDSIKESAACYSQFGVSIYYLNLSCSVLGFLFSSLFVNLSKCITAPMFVCPNTCDQCFNQCLPVSHFLSLPAAAVSASPTLSPPLAVLGAACRSGGTFASSRCPPGACRVPGWACWAAGGCWDPHLAAPAAHPPVPSKGDR